MSKTVLVTGASRGIGLALSKKLLTENYSVIGTSRQDSINEIEDQNFESIQLDIADNKSIEVACQKLKSNNTAIDLLINNAGIGPDLRSSIPNYGSFMLTFAVNVTGTVFFTEKIVDCLNENGMIINISSKMGSIDACERAGAVAYRMSKSALNMYSKILTNRYEGNIKIATLHPGWVKTTIAPDNMAMATLTAEESAQAIYNFMQTDFENGIYWDCESNVPLNW